MFNCFIKKSDPVMKPQCYKLNTRKYKEETIIAEGGFAYIWKCENFAIKRILIQSQEAYQQALNEINIMKSLPEHPNIVKLIDYGEVKIQNKIFMCSVMELSETNLFTLLSQQVMSERKVIEYFKQIVDGVEILHADQISHRDLKLENILISRGVCKICDFGSASREIIDLAQLNKQQLQQKEEYFAQTTTITYRPPEMIDVLTRQIIDTKVDIWQLGCILYSLCYRKSPFQEMNKISIAQAIFEIPQSQISIGTVTLIQKMLQQNPQKRPTIKEIKMSLYGAEEDEWGEFQ